ncbi:phospholipase B1, membrane-associated-like [Lineus longissimus]|uniref:phospholipase B1, membrane-associated-like n=1 Tax=Lineus longissimus TaxID=88925 RepID=UPI002B4D1B05
MAPLVLCVLVVLAVAAESVPPIEEINKLTFEERLTEALNYISSNATLKAAYEEHLKAYETDPLLHASADEPFPCDLKKSSAKPTSVHKLQPGDIDVVAAMGDSITGGNGIQAKTAIGVLTQWRGDSWSIGGDKTWVQRKTIPNFLRTVNPNLRGFSIGTGDKMNPNAHLNVAKAGATADNIPIQARMLVDRMKVEKGVDFENDWKVITLFIGGNDICACDLSAHNPDSYKAKIMEGLDILHAEVPRAFINLVEVLDVSILADLNGGLVCAALHIYECPCGAFPITDARRKNVQIIAKAFQATIAEIVGSGRYETKDDFTVVHQPFFRDTVPPVLANNEYDLSYFSPDCFHFSEKGHAGAAEALWNNMVEPVGMKRTEWRIGEPLECPTEEYPYFATAKNSGGRDGLKGVPNLLGAKSADTKSGLLGAQSVGGQNVGVKGARVGSDAQPIGAGAQPAFHNQQAGSENPSTGLSTTSAIILGCTLTLLVVVALALLARKTIAARAGRSRYERLPESPLIVANSTTPKYC